jgi:hypothetical protein
LGALRGGDLGGEVAGLVLREHLKLLVSLGNDYDVPLIFEINAVNINQIVVG